MRLERRSMMLAMEGKKIRLKIPYNSVSTDMGFREVISPGAFRRTLQSGDDVLAFWNHDSSMVLGRRSAGTLDLEDGPDGLSCELEEDRTTWCQDARAAVRSRNVRGASFGFMCVEDDWDRSAGEWIRTLRDVDLLEVSPCPMPAYDESEADLS